VRPVVVPPGFSNEVPAEVSGRISGWAPKKMGACRFSVAVAPRGEASGTPVLGLGIRPVPFGARQFPGFFHSRRPSLRLSRHSRLGRNVRQAARLRISYRSAAPAPSGLGLPSHQSFVTHEHFFQFAEIAAGRTECFGEIAHAARRNLRHPHPPAETLGEIPSPPLVRTISLSRRHSFVTLTFSSTTSLTRRRADSMP